jgi:hypothetical protein
MIAWKLDPDNRPNSTLDLLPQLGQIATAFQRAWKH